MQILQRNNTSIKGFTKFNVFGEKNYTQCFLFISDWCEMSQVLVKIKGKLCLQNTGKDGLVGKSNKNL